MASNTDQYCAWLFIDYIFGVTYKALIDLTGLVDAHRQGKIASLIGVEGGHSLGNSLGVLRTFYGLGARYLTLTHACDTSWWVDSFSKYRITHQFPENENNHPIAMLCPSLTVPFLLRVKLAEVIILIKCYILFFNSKKFYFSHNTSYTLWSKNEILFLTQMFLIFFFFFEEMSFLKSG